jgi:hypothetical protein
MMAWAAGAILMALCAIGSLDQHAEAGNSILDRANANPTSPAATARSAGEDGDRVGLFDGDPHLGAGAPPTAIVTYRTDCVRLCDGYFWPISEATSEANLQRDSRICASSCEQPAKLYYRATAQASPTTMTALDGTRYGQLPHAFSYRKSFDPSCRCHAEPWTESERQRHRQYAITARSAAASSDPRPAGLPADGTDIGVNASSPGPNPAIAADGLSSIPPDEDAAASQ